MAYQPGYSGLLNSAMPRIGQYEAATGKRIRYPFVQGLLAADLESSKRLAMDNYLREQALEQQRSLQQQQIDLAKKAEQNQQRASTVSGIGQLAGLYGQYKLYDKYLAGQKPATTPTTQQVGGVTNSSLGIPASSTSSVNTAAPTTYTGPLSPGYQYGGAAPSVAATSQTQAVTTPAATPLLSEGAGSTGATLTESQMVADTGGSVGWGSESAAASSGVSPATMGLGALAGIGAGMAANYLQQTGTGQRINNRGAIINRNLGGPNLSNQGFAEGGKGFASGAASGAVVGGPWGALVGGVIGAVIGVGTQAAKEKRIPGVKIGGAHIIPDVKTVLCTELHRQGELTDRDLKWARIFRMKYVSQEVYEGYIRWATPVVGWMQKSPTFNALFKPVAKAIVRSWIAMAKEGRYGFWCRVTRAVSLAAYRTPKMEVARG